MESVPQFVQGIFGFTGAGYLEPVVLDGCGYTVPSDKRTQLIYFRAGNSSDQMIYAALLRDGATMRLFPIGAKSAVHVSLAVVEDLQPDTVLSVSVGAPSGETATIVLDLGLIEI
jgi:hypothetical protein